MVKKLSDMQRDEIIKQYQSGATTYELGEEYGVCRKTISDALKKNGVELRGTRRLSEGQIDEVVKKYQDGKSTRALGKEYGFVGSTISRALKKRGLEIGTPRKPNVKPSEGQVDDIVEMYQSGESTYELGKEYGVSNRIIGRALKKRGVELRVGGDSRRKLTEAQIDEIVEKYGNGLSTIKIAKEYGVSDSTISKALKDMGVNTRQRLLPENLVDEIVEKYGNGLSTIKIAKEYGVGKTTVWKFLKERGVETRRKPHDPKKELARKLL